MAKRNRKARRKAQRTQTEESTTLSQVEDILEGLETKLNQCRQHISAMKSHTGRLAKVEPNVLGFSGMTVIAVYHELDGAEKTLAMLRGLWDNTIKNHKT